MRQVAALDNKSGEVNANRKSVHKRIGIMEMSEGELTETALYGWQMCDEVRG